MTKSTGVRKFDQIKGHASASSATNVEVYLGLPTELFHDLHDEWRRKPGEKSFSKYLVSLILKGKIK